jgi:hypothetical protein
MILPSPYLLAHPEEAPPAGGYPPIQLRDGTETFAVSLLVNGKRKVTSSEFDLTGQKPFWLSTKYRGRVRVQVELGITRWRAGRSGTSKRLIKLPTVIYPSSGTVRVSVPSISLAFPSAVKSLRAGVVFPGYPGNRKKSPFPSSSTLRPDPEIYNTPYIRRTEAYDSGSSSSSATPSFYQRYNRIWSGTRTPGFGKLKPKKLPINGTTSRITEVRDGPGVFLNHIPSTGIGFNLFTSFTELYSPPPDPYAHIAGVEFKALRKLIEKMQVGIEANLAQDLVQYNQTIRLLTKTVKRITGSFTALKSGNIPGAVKSLWGEKPPKIRGAGPQPTKTLADNWLELQYGWKPLLQDIHGSFESLAQLSVGDPFIRRVTASASMDELVNQTFGHRFHADTPAGYHSRYTVTKCKYVVRFRVDDHLQQFLQQTGFTNPVNLIWEILPLSFVVDWFVPLGPWLETQKSFDGLVFHDGSVTLFTRRKAYSVINFYGSVPTAPGQLFEEHARYTREVTQFERGRLNTFPGSYMPPTIKNGLASLTHAENALALLRSAFGVKANKSTRI